MVDIRETPVAISCVFYAVLAAFPEPPFKDGVRYVAMELQNSVQFPERISLILDCLPYAIDTFGVQTNLSSIQWFQVVTKAQVIVSTEREFEIGDNSTAHIFLAENKERLFIQELTTTRGAQVGTEAAYKCKVCRNVPPEPLLCKDATTIINVEGE